MIFNFVWQAGRQSKNIISLLSAHVRSGRIQSQYTVKRQTCLSIHILIRDQNTGIPHLKGLHIFIPLQYVGARFPLFFYGEITLCFITANFRSICVFCILAWYNDGFSCKLHYNIII